MFPLWYSTSVGGSWILYLCLQLNATSPPLTSSIASKHVFIAVSELSAPNTKIIWNLTVRPPHPSITTTMAKVKFQGCWSLDLFGTLNINTWMWDPYNFKMIVLVEYWSISNGSNLWNTRSKLGKTKNSGSLGIWTLNVGSFKFPPLELK